LEVEVGVVAGGGRRGMDGANKDRVGSSRRKGNGNTQLKKVDDGDIRNDESQNYGTTSKTFCARNTNGLNRKASLVNSIKRDGKTNSARRAWKSVDGCCCEDLDNSCGEGAWEKSDRIN